ncbi:uncharacterized protein LOC109421960 isoform X2 [Aedes albopictus]|uniref:Uncharacterized protein n=1 Tax=Aedes albopictus TaxID=7160 RepID=A0ABM1ZXP8_AEDAL
MNIDVDDFMRRSSTGYNFQYINVGNLDRIIRNVQRNSDATKKVESKSVSEVGPRSQANGNARLLSEDEINEILRAAEEDLQDKDPYPVELTEVDENQKDLKPVQDGHDSDQTVTSFSSRSSSISSIVISSSKELRDRQSDEAADVEDNLRFEEDDYTLNGFAFSSSESQLNVEQDRQIQNSIDTCFEFMDSESIIEEVILERDEERDGDSEGSVNVAPIIRVRSPVKPASAIIKTYEQECEEPVNQVQPVLDFAAIERSNKNSRSGRQSFGQKIPSLERIRPPSRKSLVEEFDTFIKITELQKKICLMIDDVRHCLGKVEEPEDELELKKREKRTAEFLIRFQRNYLYQINRLEEDVCVISKNSSEFAQKVYQLYRLIYQGLKFYLKNMKYFVISVSPEKLWTLVKQIMSSTKLCVQKEIFDEDDLIVEEIFEKSLNLRKSLKDEANKLKSKSKREKTSKVQPAKPSTASTHVTKLSMYGSTNVAQRRRPPQRRNATQPAKTPNNRKQTSSKPPSTKDIPKKTPRGRIVAVPMTKSSSSSLGQSKSSVRVRSARTPAKTIDDVVTLIQQQTDPLADSPLLKEVSSALTKMSSSRDAAISPEVNQQLHQLIMETIQNITQQQLKQLIPSLERSTAKTSNQNQQNDRAGTTGKEPSVATEVTGATDQTNRVEKRFSTKRPTSPDRKKNADDNTLDDGGVGNRQRRTSPSSASPATRHHRDCVGDSQSSDSGAATPAIKPTNAAVVVAPKGVDSEISGGKFILNEFEDGFSVDNNKHHHHHNKPVGSIVSSGKITSSRLTGSAAEQMGRGGLLEDRKRSTSTQRNPGAGPRQQKVNYSHNLQYLEIVSPPDDDRTPNAPKPGSIPEVQSHINLAEEVALKQRQQRRQEMYGQLKKQVCRDRMRTLRRMAENPVYVNDHFDRPWQTVSRISDQLVEELTEETVRQGLDFGEASFVEDFLRMQLDG